MNKRELKKSYFDWMYQKVTIEDIDEHYNYRKLLTHLHETEFIFLIPMDSNRCEDGEDLRYRFGFEKSVDAHLIASYLDDRPCSVLEMLVALSLRCEEHIMHDPEIGDRTGLWFWGMISNLNLASMTDEAFDKNYIDDVLDRLLNRTYKPNGEGGLFTIKQCTYDLRGMEIWKQLNLYVHELLF